MIALPKRLRENWDIECSSVAVSAVMDKQSDLFLPPRWGKVRIGVKRFIRRSSAPPFSSPVKGEEIKRRSLRERFE